MSYLVASMGCRKLAYYQTSTERLKVVTGKTLKPEKVAQGFISVDPLTSYYPGWSPYSFTMDTPINLIDPTGMGPTDWVQNKSGSISWDDNVTSATDTDLKADDKYLGKSGYGINAETGNVTVYQADGTKKDYTPSLSGVTITPDYAYSTKNPSSSSHNKSGYIWNNRDLAVWHSLKDDESVIGIVLRRQVKTGNFDIIDATNYWNTYGTTTGRLMLFQQYLDMMNMVNSYPVTHLSTVKGFHSIPRLNSTKSVTLNNNWNSTNPTFNQFRSSNKGAFKGYKGRGTGTKAAWEAYNHLYGD